MLHSDTSANSGFFLRIKALRGSLKKAESRLADYVIAHPNDTVKSTIHDLQRKTGTSYATVIRFSKKTGYSGFREFKESLARDLVNADTLTNLAAGFQIGKSDDMASIVQKTFQSSIETLKETREILSVRGLENAVEKILSAREIYFIGTGISGVSAKYAYTRFFRIGIKCSYETDPTIYKLKAAIAGKEDVLFAISSSGRSANIVDAAKTAHQNGATVISLCDFAISPLTRNSDINLYSTPRNTTQFSDMDVQLLTAQINIIDVLFFACCSGLDKRAIDFLNLTKSKADKEKI
ncbi:MAG TPA: MurR/RpiR family transcriptional regulator [Bacteroidetes bacterium]|nr:MurR/RpiR family transcriptional regulator [Bacteroidota bacterium]